GVLIHVEHNVERLLRQHLLDVGHLLREGDVEPALLYEQPCTCGMPSEHKHRVFLRELLERCIPLTHLIDVHVAVSEVHADTVVPLGQGAALCDQLANCEQCTSPL